MTLSPNQIKVGDVLIRREDHLGRPDDRLTVIAKETYGTTQYRLKGYWRDKETAKSLCAKGYRIVERDNREIGTFFTRYW